MIIPPIILSTTNVVLLFLLPTYIIEVQIRTIMVI